MLTDRKPASTLDWERYVSQCMFSGLRGLEAGDDAEVGLGSGFSLVRPNEFLLSARDRDSMTGREFADAATVSRYLVYQQEPTVPVKTYQQIKAIFQGGMLALQVIKPVLTNGIVFYGDYTPGGRFSLQGIERRPPMEPGPWALQRTFDQELLKTASSTIAGGQAILKGCNAEKRNAFHLLQLGLEHFHPLVAGLLWVMGLEAIFDSRNRNLFGTKLCDYLGPSARIFPDWNANQPSYTVEETAIHLYTLRSKLVHGVDLRKAASDPKFPVDLIKKHILPSSPDPVPYSMILSEAACYLLCQVLKKEIAESAEGDYPDNKP